MVAGTIIGSRASWWHLAGIAAGVLVWLLWPTVPGPLAGTTAERRGGFSDRLQLDITVVRWGLFGAPVLVFPPTDGDAAEIERQGLVNACGPLLAEGRIKLYSVDSVAGQ